MQLKVSVAFMQMNVSTVNVWVNNFYRNYAGGSLHCNYAGGIMFLQCIMYMTISIVIECDCFCCSYVCDSFK